MKKPIHVIGDSHVSLFSGKDQIVPTWNEPHEDALPQFRTYRLGAMLAYNLATEGHEGRDKLFTLLDTLPKRSKVLLCFGEIDCRAHIVKQAWARNETIAAIANNVAERYFEAIKAVKAHPNVSKLAIWGATPQSAAEHSSNKFPTVGTQRERNLATIHFNTHLANLCLVIDVPVFTIFEQIVEDSPQLVSKPEYFFDSAHLSQKALPFALEALAPFLS